MLKEMVCTAVLLAGSLSHAQARHHQRNGGIGSFDAAVTADFEHAQVAQAGGRRFWMKGGGVNASLALWHGLGIAADLSGEHASEIAPGIAPGKVSYMFGPRYTKTLFEGGGGGGGRRRVTLYGQFLAGGAHGFDALFPAGGSSLTGSADSVSLLAGGGVDLGLASHLGVRLLDVGLVHTAFPNNAGNTQNGVRLGFGLSVRH